MLPGVASSPVDVSAIDANANLTRHVRLWNAQTLRSFSSKLAQLNATIETVFGKTMDSATPVVTEDQFRSVAAALKGTDKKFAILTSIGLSAGRQLCHADTMVAACLVDELGALEKFTRRCKPAYDASCALTYPPDKLATTAVLIAETPEDRAELTNASIAVLATALKAAGLVGAGSSASFPVGSAPQSRSHAG